MALECATHWIELLIQLNRLIREIAIHDNDLARQIRRAATSVALNLAEGNGSTKGTRKTRFESAYASLKETETGLKVATALGYIPPITPTIVDRIDHIAASIWKLTHRR